MKKKIVRIIKREVKCDVPGCLCTCDLFYVMFNDFEKPGATDPHGKQLSTRSATVCSAEHALVMMRQILVEEGEIPSSDVPLQLKEQI